MEALGRFFMSLERLTGLALFADLGRPFLDVASKKRQFDSNVANAKSSAKNVKDNFDKLKPKDKVS